MLGSARSAAAALGSPPSTDAKASQVNPDSRGVVSRWPRLAANTSEAVRAAMLRVAPKVAERTGTAVRPRPGCSAIWIPVAAAGERQARDSAEVNAEDRARPGPGPSLLTVAAVRAAVHAGTAEASIVRRATKPRREPAAKRPRRIQGRVRRSWPSRLGRVARAGRRPGRLHRRPPRRWRRPARCLARPTGRGKSRAPTGRADRPSPGRFCRACDCPTMANAASPVRTQSAHSAWDSSRIDRWIPAVWVCCTSGISAPPRPAARIWRRNASRFAAPWRSLISSAASPGGGRMPFDRTKAGVT